MRKIKQYNVHRTRLFYTISVTKVHFENAEAMRAPQGAAMFHLSSSDAKNKSLFTSLQIAIPIDGWLCLGCV